MNCFLEWLKHDIIEITLLKTEKYLYRSYRNSPTKKISLQKKHRNNSFEMLGGTSGYSSLLVSLGYDKRQMV